MKQIKCPECKGKKTTNVKIPTGIEPMNAVREYTVIKIVCPNCLGKGKVKDKKQKEKNVEQKSSRV